MGCELKGFWKQFLPPSSELRQYDRINYGSVTKFYLLTQIRYLELFQDFGLRGEWGNGRKQILWKSKEVGTHHWLDSSESAGERGQQPSSQRTHYSFQGSATVWIDRVRPGGQGQEDSKTLGTSFNGRLKIPLTRVWNQGSPSWLKASYACHFNGCRWASLRKQSVGQAG